MLASRYGCSSVVSMLLDVKANPGCRDEKGSTALFHAVTSRSVDIINQLVAANADVNAINRVNERKFSSQLLLC
jgi:ankyrin repeat protein